MVRRGGLPPRAGAQRFLSEGQVRPGDTGCEAEDAADAFRAGASTLRRILALNLVEAGYADVSVDWYDRPTRRRKHGGVPASPFSSWSASSCFCGGLMVKSLAIALLADPSCPTISSPAAAGAGAFFAADANHTCRECLQCANMRGEKDRQEEPNLRKARGRKALLSPRGSAADPPQRDGVRTRRVQYSRPDDLGPEGLSISWRRATNLSFLMLALRKLAASQPKAISGRLLVSMRAMLSKGGCRRERTSAANR